MRAVTPPHSTACSPQRAVSGSSAMMLVVDQDHDDIGLLRGIGRRHDLQALCLRLRAALAAGWKTYHDITAVVAHVESMRVPLAAVTDDGHAFALDQFQVGVRVII